jgi:hypothetical protein
MARYPSVPPAWAGKAYGGNAEAWDEAVRQCRAVLVGWAKQGTFGYYSDLSNLVTAIPWPEGPHTHEGHQMGRLLGEVSLNELVTGEDRPLLSSLVIAKDQGMPSGGYWSFLEELGEPVANIGLRRYEAWVAEFKRACAYFGSAR